MIIQGKKKFKHGLSSMSNATVKRAYAARLAFKKCVLAHISVTQAEIDTLEKQRDFIQSLDNDIHCNLTSVKEMMDKREIIDDTYLLPSYDICMLMNLLCLQFLTRSYIS